MSAPTELPSPFRATVAVLAGFLLNFFLAGVGSGTLAAFFPQHFPMPVAADGAPLPTDTGLVLVCVMFAANALLSGVLTGRIAKTAHVAHTAILAGLFGLFALYGMDQARPYPGWVAIAFVLVPPTFVMLGGVIAARAARQRNERVKARRIHVEKVPSPHATEKAESKGSG